MKVFEYESNYCLKLEYLSVTDSVIVSWEKGEKENQIWGLKETEILSF